jgi:hypothetical protein
MRTCREAPGDPQRGSPGSGWDEDVGQHGTPFAGSSRKEADGQGKKETGRELFGKLPAIRRPAYPISGWDEEVCGR